MNGFLLGTNCISEVVSPRPERRVLDWLDRTDEALLHLSVLTLGEIRKGIAGLAQGKRRTQLESWLETDLPARFSGRILTIDRSVACLLYTSGRAPTGADGAEVVEFGVDADGDDAPFGQGEWWLGDDGREDSRA